jgi:UDP-N-acetylmuramoyl-L-alanyl-D-glutamate--2,6-diaminopimelate ligase
MRTSSSSRAGGISLADLFPKSRFFGGGPFSINSCCDNARYCQPGDLYAAVHRASEDGHDLVQEAIQRGAVAVLAERPVTMDVPHCIVRDSRSAFSVLCQALAGNPTSQLCTAGISGTHGKTVVSVLLTSILEAAGQSVGIVNSLGCCDGVNLGAPGASELAPPDLARWCANFVRHGCTHSVLETSSVNLAARNMDGVGLDVGIVTNIRRASLNFHGSVQNYRRAEERLWRLLKPRGVAVLNADDPVSQFSSSKLDCPSISFGWNERADVRAESLGNHPGEQCFLLSIGDESIPVTTSLTGMPYVTNCLAAAAAAAALGVELDVIARGIESVKRIPGRMERMSGEAEVPIFFDLTTTPDALAAMLTSLRRITTGRVVCVLGIAEHHEPQDRVMYGRVLERLADTGIITASNHAAKLPLPVAHDVLDGYDRPAVAHLIPDRAAAIRWALEKTRTGDTLYFVGRNHERTIEPHESGFAGPVAEDDREVVSSTLGQSERPRVFRFAA